MDLDRDYKELLLRMAKNQNLANIALRKQLASSGMAEDYDYATQLARGQGHLEAIIERIERSEEKKRLG